jgi:hypothetical protein
VGGGPGRGAGLVQPLDQHDRVQEPSSEALSGFCGPGEVLEIPEPLVTLVFAPQGTRRTAVAAEPATTILVIDGAPGKVYDATGWELWAPIRPLYDQGEHAELRARLEALIAANPQYPMLVYNLACSDALSGHTADAIDHLRRAISASEKFRANAREDSDFDAIRDEPSFKALVG